MIKGFEKIRTRKEYLKQFKGKIPDKAKDRNKIERALEIALDTRKFEIELYWKRATYFWAFIAVTFTGYFIVLSSDTINQYRGITIMISFLGLMFSLGWYFVNRGSKFWQENWEQHVSFLEDDIQGPLFKVYKYPNHKLNTLTGGYPFSVTKVNQLLSLFVVFFWLILFVYSVFFSFDKVIYINDVYDKIPVSVPILICLSIIIPIYIFTRLSYSFLKKQEKNFNKTISGEGMGNKKKSIKFLKKN